MFVSDVYGFMRRILCLIFIVPSFNVTVSLVQHCVIKYGPLYGGGEIRANHGTLTGPAGEGATEGLLNGTDQ